MNNTLTEIFLEIGHFGGDVGHNDKGGTHSYLSTYETLFSPFRNGCTMMEMGTAQGMSLKLWDKYFINSTIIGVDLSFPFDGLRLIQDGVNKIRLVEGNCTKIDFLQELQELQEFYDIVIDDASHMGEDQIKTFNLVKPYMKKGGVYIIEDILNIDVMRPVLLSLHSNCEIIDLRNVKGRFDDVLVVYKF